MDGRKGATMLYPPVYFYQDVTVLGDEKHHGKASRCGYFIHLIREWVKSKSPFKCLAMNTENLHVSQELRRPQRYDCLHLSQVRIIVTSQVEYKVGN